MSLSLNATNCLILFSIFAVWSSLFCLRFIVSSSDCNKQLGYKGHKTTKWRITMNSYCGNGGMAPPTITLGDSWSAVPLLVKTSGGTQYDSRWVSEPVWTYWKEKKKFMPILEIESRFHGSPTRSLAAVSIWYPGFPLDMWLKTESFSSIREEKLEK